MNYLERFVACQMDQLNMLNAITIKATNLYLKLPDRTLLFDGFLKVYAADEDEKEKKVVLPADIESTLALRQNKKTEFTSRLQNILGSFAC